jgi:hypothetical protein
MNEERCVHCDWRGTWQDLLLHEYKHNPAPQPERRQGPTQTEVDEAIASIVTAIPNK